MSQVEAVAVMDLLAAHPAIEFQGRCSGVDAPSKATRSTGANYYANLMTAQDLRRSADPVSAIRAAEPPPTLVTRGACDYIPASALGRYEAAYPDLTIVEVAGAGHSFLGSRPDVIVPQAVCSFAGASDPSCREIASRG